MNILCLLTLFMCSCVLGQDRKIKSQLNPDCNDCDNNNVLVYTRAEGSHDTIHQLWDFTYRIPTVTFAVTSANGTLKVDWELKKAVFFKFSEKPHYTFSMVIDELIEYEEDCHAKVCPHRNIALGGWWSWRALNYTGGEGRVTLAVRGEVPDEPRRGVINVKLDYIPFDDYAVDLPHLIHTANSTLFDVSMVDIGCRYNASRIGARLVIAATDWDDRGMKLATRKSLDDEHTPAVFEIIEIQTPQSLNSGEGGFVQFRPVGYTTPERSVATSVTAQVSDLGKLKLPDSLLRYFVYTSPILVQETVMTFGDDGETYQQHNYTAWSFTIGYGRPPIESFSLFVVLVISIGLGIPVLLALSGIVYVLVKRVRHRNAPQRFLNEE